MTRHVLREHFRLQRNTKASDDYRRRPTKKLSAETSFHDGSSAFRSRVCRIMLRMISISFYTTEAQSAILHNRQTSFRGTRRINHCETNERVKIYVCRADKYSFAL